MFIHQERIEIFNIKLLKDVIFYFIFRIFCHISFIAYTHKQESVVRTNSWLPRWTIKVEILVELWLAQFRFWVLMNPHTRPCEKILLQACCTLTLIVFYWNETYRLSNPCSVFLFEADSWLKCLLLRLLSRLLFVICCPVTPAGGGHRHPPVYYFFLIGLLLNVVRKCTHILSLWKNLTMGLLYHSH